MIGARNELKYYINSADADLLNRRLSIAMEKDVHAGKFGSYRIRSLYFDDPDACAYFDKINGLEKRSKHRIRYYNDDLSYIRLEKKDKIGKKCIKTFEQISLPLARALISSDPDSSFFGGDLSEKMIAKIRYEHFRPLLFVDYYRSAYLHPVGNVRITIDKNLSAAAFHHSLNDPSFSIPVLSDGNVILEIKYDDYFPPYLSELLKDIPKLPSAISKFCLCREALF